MHWAISLFVSLGISYSQWLYVWVYMCAFICAKPRWVSFPPCCAMRIQSSGLTCNQSCWFLCGALGWWNEETVREQMKEAKGGGRNIQEGIGGRKKQKARLGPTRLGLRQFKTLLRALGPSESNLLPLRDGSHQDHEEQWATVLWEISIRNRAASPTEIHFCSQKIMSHRFKNW